MRFALYLRALALLLMTVSGLPAAAQTPPAASGDVDLALVLTVDVSRSMDLDEQAVQRDGYVEAFRSPEVISAISDGQLGRIAVTYVEWAASDFQTVVIPWRIIDGKAAAEAFAADLDAAEIERWNGTSISGALMFSQHLLDTSGVNAIRRVIDVSGDGVNNNGAPVGPMRDFVVAQGVTINGLPIILDNDTSFGGGPSSPNLEAYYRDCVIGGPNAFLLTVHKADQFATAIRQKLVLEIAAAPSAAPRGLVRPAQYQIATNCIVGDFYRFGP